jgi:methionine synthase II (cobalamin-independent)
MPGTDPRETIRTVVAELEAFPFLPELPARGPGADIIGRTAALLVDMPVEVTPRGWRLAEHRGRDMNRARSMLGNDLDELEEHLQGYQGPLKIQLCGPWTLAASIELTRTMDAALSDPGAVKDLADSLAEGAGLHIADVHNRVPGAVLVVQFDEPALSAVADGRVPTASGISRLPAIEPETIIERLRQVIAATSEYVVVHCCDSHVRYDTIAKAGASAVSFDLGLLRREEEDAIAELTEAGLGFFTGIGDTTGKPEQIADRVLQPWRRMGVVPETGQIVITPACGLASLSPLEARATLRKCREAAAILPELIGD